MKTKKMIGFNEEDSFKKQESQFLSEVFAGNIDIDEFKNYVEQAFSNKEQGFSEKQKNIFINLFATKLDLSYQDKENNQNFGKIFLELYKSDFIKEKFHLSDFAIEHDISIDTKTLVGGSHSDSDYEF